MCSIAHFVIIELLAYLFECNYRIIIAIWRYGDMAIWRQVRYYHGDAMRCDAMQQIESGLLL